jgi:NAD(P)-dependent dehydrogenase (short-subunit alcohol dehydrogenase family)
VQDLIGLDAVVTGGNGGIGLAMAQGIGKAGARIAIWSRDQKKNDAAVRQLESQDVEAFAVRCDIGIERDVESAMAATLEKYGKVDCLVANAAVATSAPFVETELADWQRVLRTNLDGSFLCARAATRHMVERGEGGSVIIVSSIISRYGASGRAAYTTSKMGLIGLGRTLAVELARHRIRCNILIPGWTETPINESLIEDERFVKAITARTPVRRWAKPDEFEDVAVFLADPRLTFHTGNEVVVDGGYTIY